MIKKIKNCKTCPLYIKLHDLELCVHPMNNEFKVVNNLFEVCPLKKQSCILELDNEELNDQRT
jgi:hypothetical protein